MAKKVLKKTNKVKNTKKKESIVVHEKIYDISNSRDISEIMSENYLSYSLNTLTRAIPFVNDGLNPVRRRILYVLLNYERRLTKSARIVGDTIGQFHPHGDTSVYGTMVNMSQDFKMNYPLLIGQGNWGNIDGDSAAAMRYTECKLSEFAKDVYFGEGWQYIDMRYNYDDTLYEPVCFAPAIPMLLINGSKGIVSGFANNIPPHNLKEVCDYTIDYLNKGKGKLNIREYILGPDFPTGGEIINKREYLSRAITTGKGNLLVRPTYTLKEYKKDRWMIEITELPYGRDKGAMLDVFTSRYPEDPELRNIHNDGVVDLSTDKICLQLHCKKSVDKKKAKELMEYMIKIGIFSSEVKYISYVVIYDPNNKITLPKRVGVDEIIDAWYDYRSIVVKKYCDMKIADLEKAIVMNKYLQIFVKNYKKLAYVILDYRYDDALIEFKKYDIPKEGFDYILGKTFSSISDKGDKILSDGENLKKELAIFTNRKTNVKKYIINEVKAIRDKYSRDRSTRLVYDDVDMDKKIENKLALKEITNVKELKKNNLSKTKIEKEKDIKDGKGKTTKRTTKKEVSSKQQKEKESKPSKRKNTISTSTKSKGKNISKSSTRK